MYLSNELYNKKSNSNIMKKNTVLYAALAGLLLSTGSAFAQQGMGTNNPDASSVLDMQSSERGLLIPRLELTATDNQAPIVTTPANSLLVYNTKTNGTGATAVKPGYYYWDVNKWQRVANVEDVTTIVGNASTAGNTGADYKVDTEIPTGEYFWTDASTKKVVYRKMIEVNFPTKTYTNVTGKVNDQAQFIRAQIIDKDTGRVIVNSAEFKPNSGAEFKGTTTDDYFVAKFGGMSTTLSGDYRMILEYYIP